MKTKIMKISFCIVSVFVILVSMCPIPAFAADVISDVFYMPMSKPNVDNNSGYAEIFWSDGVGNKYVDVVSWTFTPIVNMSNHDFMPTTNQLLCSTVYSDTHASFSFKANDYCDGYFALTYANNRGGYFIRCLPMDGTTEPFIENLTDNSGCTIQGFHFYGNVQTTNGSPSTLDSFSVVYAEDAVISSNLDNILTTLNVLFYLTEDYDASMLEYIDSMITSLNNFKGSFEEFEEFYKSKMTILLSYCEDYFQYLKTLVEYTDDLEAYADLILTSCLAIEVWISDLYWIEIDSNSKLGDINSKLQRIIEILESRGESDLTQPDTSNLNGYYDIEQSLLDDSNVDPSQVLNIELNQNALSAIWNLIDRFLNVNPKVFGAVIIILSLGILALILGR